MLTRRDVIRAGAGMAATLGLAPAFWRTTRAAAAAPATPGAGPYGPLGPPDANGIRLPAGFKSRVVAQGYAPVEGTAYVWHPASDGSATFPTPDGGWILVSNSEVPAIGQGGASAIRFDADGRLVDAYRVLSGTTMNCAGGPTPWGTWLSCEEHDRGLVWECDPTGARPAVARPAMGRFSHEAAAVDPDGQAVYLTEDKRGGGFYRFLPDAYPDLSKGRLEIAIVEEDGRVTWAEVPDPQGGSANPTRNQVRGSTRFERAEGIWFDAGIVYLATTADSKVHAYDTAARRMTVVYDASRGADAPLLNPDNLTVAASGDIFVGENSGGDDPLDLGIITPDGEVARFLKLTGAQHRNAEENSMSEVTGPCFDPSGTRLYFSSQRAYGTGQIYEITGPFRQQRAAGAPIGRAVVPPPAPAIGLEVPRRRARGALLRSGLPVALTLDRPARVTIVARAAFGPRGRRRMVTLGRISRQVDAGPEQLRLELDRGARQRVRGRRRLRIVVDVVVAEGRQRRKVRRRVLVTHRGR